MEASLADWQERRAPLPDLKLRPRGLTSRLVRHGIRQTWVTTLL
jgi:hypothetical protein